ncbi:MAG: hypothetical protein ABEK84_05595 [Salinibacter sp.]
MFLYLFIAAESPPYWEHALVVGLNRNRAYPTVQTVRKKTASEEAPAPDPDPAGPPPATVPDPFLPLHDVLA